MEYNPKEEIAVFSAIRELKEASTDEVLNYLNKQMKMEIKKDKLIRYLRKHKAGKVIAGNYHNGELLWKMADIPAWYSSGIMAICNSTSTEIEMKLALESLNEKIKKEPRIIEPRGVWGDYHTFDMTFETITPILGGWSNGEERKLVFPKIDGKLVILPNWMYGLMRNNAALIDLPQSITYHLAISKGTFLEQPKTEWKQLKVKEGMCDYEMIPKGCKFKLMMRFPFRGSKLKTKQQIVDWFKMIEEAGLDGLGANSKVFGGIIKLVKIEGS